ncbi:MAG: sugar ABC transporter permease, partial [Spirochaetota bacterium]
MIEQKMFLRPIILTMLYAATCMMAENVAGLSLALALEQTNRINGFFRSLFFVPVLLSPVTVGYIWRGLLDPAGVFNRVLSTILPGIDIKIAWLGIPSITIFIVALIEAWKWSGFSTLVYIAGLASIPDSFKEAARAEGTNEWYIFWKIKRPMLAPAFTFNITITLIGSMNAFDTIMATTRGGP